MKGIDSSLAQAFDYARRNWHVFPLVPKGKEPLKDWKWADKRVPFEEIPYRFGDSQNNIGIGLGHLSGGLVDIDLDWPEVRAIADATKIFDDLPAFGRDGAPNSHRVAICVDARRPQTKKAEKSDLGGVKKFTLPSVMKDDPRLPPADEHPLCVAELRGSGGYTMFPGSIHPSGEAVCWQTDLANSLPELTWEELERRVGLVAFLAVVLRFYPGVGARDETCMALAGTLLRVFEKEDPESVAEKVDFLVKVIAELAHDEETEQKRQKAAATLQKMQAGEPCTGFPRLMELLGVPQGSGIRRWLGVGPEVDGLPLISMNGDLRSRLDRAEAALKAGEVPIYQRGGKLVRVLRLDEDTEPVEGVRRRCGSLTIDEVEPYWFSQQLQGVATFVNGQGKPKRVEPSITFCNHYIVGRRGDWRLPVLRGVIEAPTLRSDGTLLQEEGYDRKSGLIADFAPSIFPDINENPTRGEAEKALESFIEVIRCFPFCPDDMSENWLPSEDEGRKPSASRSVILSAWLSGLMRRSLRTLPLHAVDAPSMGTGKTKLADIIAIILTGRAANVMSQGGSEEEDEKRLFATLWAGDPVVVIDNIERPLHGSALCSILTQESWKSRILGKSQTVPVATNVLFMATGNNLVLSGDMTRRVVVCRLDARAERPDERQFGFDPTKLAGERRSELVVAGLTILRAYFAAGCPMRGKIPHVGSFEDWTLIREALVWLGQPDPAFTRQRVLENDPRRDELCEVMNAWERSFENRALTLAEVKKAIERVEKSTKIDANLEDLGRALRGLTRNGELNVKSLGWWFRRNVSVVVGGRQFVAVSQNSAREKVYRLVSVEDSSPSPAEPEEPDVDYFADFQPSI